MQLIQLSGSEDSLCLSFLCFLTSAFSLYVCNTQQHYCPEVRPRLQIDWCPYVNGCSRLRRGRCLQRITGSSLATTCGPLVLQKRVKQNVSRFLTETMSQQLELCDIQYVQENLLSHSYSIYTDVHSILNPRFLSWSPQTNVLTTYSVMNWAAKQTECLPFHSWFRGGWLVSS